MEKWAKILAAVLYLDQIDVDGLNCTSSFKNSVAHYLNELTNASEAAAVAIALQNLCDNDGKLESFGRL